MSYKLKSIDHTQVPATMVLRYLCCLVSLILSCFHYTMKVNRYSLFSRPMKLRINVYAVHKSRLLDAFLLFTSFIDETKIYIIFHEGGRGKQKATQWGCWPGGGRIQSRKLHVRMPPPYLFDHRSIKHLSLILASFRYEPF